MTASVRPVVVLVPGMGNNARLWSQQVTALSSDYKVIVATYEGAESIEEMANRVLAQVPTGSFSLAGFSLGGYIALNLAGRHAERIDRLALISASPFPDSEQAIMERQLLIARAAENYDGVLADIAKFIVCPDGPFAREARDAVMVMGRELGVEEFCRQQRAAMQRPDAREALSSIETQVMVLCGAEDRVTPVSGNQYLADHIPGASLRVLERTGHLLPLERPVEVSQFLGQWLRSG